MLYKIEKDENRIVPLKKERFTDLGISERGHLQEWIVKEPNFFGEELLIIQKEFDGFHETRERLDLLALDKEGNLVVIENKLDDSGRDVVWQALKYASYCSTMSKSEVVNAFQDYLNKYFRGGIAQDLICEFLGESDMEEVVLNSDNGQRVIFVAAGYRKEVTSTAIWLLSHGIRIQCFMAVPYSMEGNLLLTVDQITLTSEGEEYMIKMSDKREKQKITEHKLEKVQEARLDFWGQVLDAMEPGGCSLFNNRAATKDHWIDASMGMSGFALQLVQTKDKTKVQLVIKSADKNKNITRFDQLKNKRVELEQDLGEEVEWINRDHQKWSFVLSKKSFDFNNRGNWKEIVDWMVEKASKFERAFKPAIDEIKQHENQAPGAKEA